MPSNVDDDPLEGMTWRADMIAMTIAALGLIDDDQIELDLAALALSELDHPAVDLSAYTALLNEIGEQLQSIGAEARTSREQATLLSTVLHSEYGFRGDVDSYDAPLNGDLIRVLDRRQGLPVSLSILYVAAARRLGWRADPLNTPGHVLVRLGREDPVVIDPFNGGAIVEQRQLIALLGQAVAGGAKISAEHSGPMSNRRTLVRLLMNQASRAEATGDPGRAMTIYARMTAIAPDNPDGWWALARLQLAAGMVAEARKSLSSVLEVTRDVEQRALVSATIEQLFQA